MAYCDYGAEVYMNGQRRRDKEDCVLFEFYPDPPEDFSDYCHGLMGDGDIRVKCYKQGLPKIFELQNGVEKNVEFVPEGVDHFEYDDVLFEYKGYKFKFVSDRPFTAYMTEPNGTKWECHYDYHYGSGFSD